MANELTCARTCLPMWIVTHICDIMTCRAPISLKLRESEKITVRQILSADCCLLISSVIKCVIKVKQISDFFQGHIFSDKITNLMLSLIAVERHFGALPVIEFLRFAFCILSLDRLVSSRCNFLKIAKSKLIFARLCQETGLLSQSGKISKLQFDSLVAVSLAQANLLGEQP